MKRFARSQAGSMTIEATISVLAFVFVMITLLTIINVSRARTAIQAAVNKSALEISQYMYLYKISGLYDLDMTLQEEGDAGLGKVDSSAKKLEDMSAGIGALFQGVASSGKSVQSSFSEGDMGAALEELKQAAAEGKDQAEEIKTHYSALEAEIKGIAEDPLQFVKSLGALGVSAGMSEAKSFLIGSLLAKAMMCNHLETDTMTADQRLRSLGVVDGEKGLDLSRSSVFSIYSASANPGEDINIVAVYKLKLFPLLKADFTVTYAQSASVRAWLGGDAA